MQSSCVSDYMHFSVFVALSSVLSSLSPRRKALLISIASLLFSIPPLIFSLSESFYHPSPPISSSSLKLSCFLSYLSLLRHPRHPRIPLSTQSLIILSLCLNHCFYPSLCICCSISAPIRSFIPTSLQITSFFLCASLPTFFHHPSLPPSFLNFSN